MFPRPSRFSRKARQTPISNKAAKVEVEEIKVTEVPEMRHIGGPWYQIGDEKYLGKSAAEEAMAAIIEGIVK